MSLDNLDHEMLKKQFEKLVCVLEKIVEELRSLNDKQRK